MNYPYYIVPDVEEYRKLDPDSERAKILSQRIAVNVGDLASLRLILGIDPPEFARFYPDMDTNTPSTLDTIDSFLDKFGSKFPSDSLGEFTAYQIQPEEQEIQEIHKEASIPEQETIQNSDTSVEREESFSLSHLLKEKRFDDALKFIEGQNLINPQKSIYFAHQIRFIKKLKAVETYKNKTKGLNKGR